MCDIVGWLARWDGLVHLSVSLSIAISSLSQIHIITKLSPYQAGPELYQILLITLCTLYYTLSSRKIR